MKTPRRKVWDLAGEAQINDDGTPRQRVLTVLIPGDPVLLQRQPANPFDANTIAVLAGNHQIGFITRTDAAELAPLLDAGVPHRAQLHQLTGGMPDYPSFGAKICIAWRSSALLTPLPIRPEQTLHQSAMGATGKVHGNTAPPTPRLAIAAAVIFVVACVLFAIFH